MSHSFKNPNGSKVSYKSSVSAIQKENRKGRERAKDIKATMKPVRGFFSTLKQTNPVIYEKLFQLYADGKWVVGYKYLHEEKRRRILEKLRPIVLKQGLSFASCREGLHNSTPHYAMAQPIAEAY